MAQVDQDVAEDRLLTPSQAAEFLHVPVSTLAAWRSKTSGAGPAYRKHGRRVAYLLSDLISWSNARRVPPQP